MAFMAYINKESLRPLWLICPAVEACFTAFPGVLINICLAAPEDLSGVVRVASPSVKRVVVERVSA